jgi:hypothetical protein
VTLERTNPEKEQSWMEVCFSHGQERPVGSLLGGGRGAATLGVAQTRQPLPVAAVGDRDREDTTCEGTWAQMNIQWIFGHHVLVIHNPKHFPDFRYKYYTTPTQSNPI